MIAWAVCCTAMGFVKNYHGLLAARACLGIAEGGLFPGGP
jgi:predicted MFS family arabinose efflux permease